MIVSAVQAEVSLVQMFLAGFVPGAVVMLLYSGYIALWSLLHPDNQPPPEPSSSFLAKLKASASLIPTFRLIGFLEL
jgi:TRAP-type mannitol/chloroaromatic compound transport system permease large subunit